MGEILFAVKNRVCARACARVHVCGFCWYASMCWVQCSLDKCHHDVVTMLSPLLEIARDFPVLLWLNRVGCWQRGKKHV